MKKMSEKKRNRRICAGVLAAVFGIAAVLPSDVWGMEREVAKESVEPEADGGETPGEWDSTVDEASRGDYVVYAEDGVEEACLEESQEIAQDAESSIYETDLSVEEVRRLKESGETLVEENFFLSGAKTKARKEKKNKWEIKSGKKEKKETEWNYKMVRADEAAVAPDGKGTVKVAVLDSGVELLSGIPVAGSVNLVKEEQYLPYYMDDMVGHGTAAADIIHQICPEAEIYSVRVLDSENRGRLSDVVEGIHWCIEQGMDVINMSFGTEMESEILKSAVKAASDAGILLVGSAGNGGSEAAVERPAAFPEVIAVGAVDTSAQKTEESATGPEVELVAPGEQILTKSVFGMETVNSGTSMAAPHVTGAAALLMRQDEGKEAEEIRRILDASGNPVGEAEAYGYGLLDVEYAQELLEDGGAALEGFSARTNAQEKTPVREKEDVQTFEEVDYVEGRWHRNDHEQLIEDGAREYQDFTEIQIKLLKAGAVYPDKALPHREVFPEWHGYYRENYIANYIFATKIAKNGGKAESLAKVKGQSNSCYDRMKTAVSIDGIMWQTEKPSDKLQFIQIKGWDIIIQSGTGLNYIEQRDSIKAEWRRYFLYGMAAHTATDAWAHSSCYKDSSGYHLINHPDADDSEKKKNRFKCAADTAYLVASTAQLGVLGNALDFDFYGENYWTGFYMGNILNYVLASDYENIGSSYLTKHFKDINCSY